MSEETPIADNGMLEVDLSFSDIVPPTPEKEPATPTAENNDSPEETTVNPIDLDPRFDFGDLPYMEGIGDWKDGDPLILPSQRAKHTVDILTNAKNIAGTTDEMVEWFNTLDQTANVGAKIGTADKALDDEDAKWVQGIIVDENGAVRNLVLPKVSTASAGHRLTGELALGAISRAISRGRTVWTSLPLSGYWAGVRAPSLDADIDLDEVIAAEKTILGCMTGGTAWSQVSTYTVRHLVNFIFDHIYDTNVKGFDKEWFIDNTPLPDITNLARAMLSARYTRGYPLKRPCTYHPEKCTSIVSQHVNFGKMLYIDNNKLTKEQRFHLGRISKKLEKKEVEEYQAQFAFKGEVTELTESMRIHHKIPTIREFLEGGNDWITGLSTAAEAVLQQRPGQDRNRYMDKQSRATAACQYSSWIKMFEIITPSESPEEEDLVQVIDDHETIVSVLARYSDDADFLEKVQESVLNYISATTVSVFGIPNYTCKCCGNTQNVIEHEYPSIVPLDIIQVFMNLVNLRLKRLSTQRL